MNVTRFRSTISVPPLSASSYRRFRSWATVEMSISPVTAAITTPCSSRTALSRAPPMTRLPSHANVPRPTDRAAAITRKRAESGCSYCPPVRRSCQLGARGLKDRGEPGPFGTHGGVELQRRTDVNRLRPAQPPGDRPDAESRNQRGARLDRDDHGRQRNLRHPLQVGVNRDRSALGRWLGAEGQEE